MENFCIILLQNSNNRKIHQQLVSQMLLIFRTFFLALVLKPGQGVAQYFLHFWKIDPSNIKAVLNHTWLHIDLSFLIFSRILLLILMLCNMEENLIQYNTVMYYQNRNFCFLYCCFVYRENGWNGFHKYYIVLENNPSIKKRLKVKKICYSERIHK